MIRKIPFAAACLGGSILLASCSVDDFLATATADGADTTLSGKVVRGLKTALALGIDSSSNAAAKVNGYLANKAIKILLPEEAARALEAAQAVGAYVAPFKSELQLMQTAVNLTPGIDKGSFQSNLSASGTLLTDIAGLQTLGDSLVFYMNRAAEYAAPRSVPIFKKAITGMTIVDGLELLNSSDSTAATGYLNGKTFSPLVSAYSPIVDSTLAKVPLAKYWGRFRTTYNAVLARYDEMLGFQDSWNGNAVVASFPDLQVDALEPVSYQPIATENLGEWTTAKALGGLFYLVGQEEKDIRRDPFAYAKGLASDVSALLGEVFGEIMEMKR
ncbi:MAG TPA: DUF4197 domain-containing protein [Fibrobacteria bacterium]|nr:DUF4197 domain-containing protein [Fibrobacteria bacterium]